MGSTKPNQNPKREPAGESHTDKRQMPERGTKRAFLLELISWQGGSTLAEISSAMGWLPHTARAAITGLRKRGHDVRRKKNEGISRYIVDGTGR